MPTYLGYKSSRSPGEPPNQQSSSSSSASPAISASGDFLSSTMSQLPCECLQRGRYCCHQGCTGSLVQYTAQPILPSRSMPLNAVGSSAYSGSMSGNYNMQLDPLQAAPYPWSHTYSSMPWHANAVAEHQLTHATSFQPNGYTTCAPPSSLPSMMPQHEPFRFVSEGFPSREKAPTQRPEALEAK